MLRAKLPKGTLFMAAVLLGALLTAPPASAEPAAPADPAPPAESIAPAAPVVGNLVLAPDGSNVTIGAINPPSRLAGLVAVYTPSFGVSTGTNQAGAEAVLEPTATAGTYRVVGACTALVPCSGAVTSPGDNAIPADGIVLSISPGGSPDARTFIRDDLAAGDEVVIKDQTSRTSKTTIDATDPTAVTNPSGVDPSSGECFPGCRGSEQLVVYTPASGRATTGTNDYGSEVTVVGGTVVEAGGSNNAIPSDGYVLSGHGSRGTWLQTNAVLGATVEIDGTTLRVTVDQRTAIYSAQQAIKTAQASIDSAHASCLDFPEKSANDALTTAQSILNTATQTTDPAQVEKLAQQAQNTALIASYQSTESRPAEGRGVWVRPTETTPEQIAATVKRIKDAGFNIIFLETFFQGYTIYPSQVAASYGIAAQRPNMVGFDPLRVWIDQAHAAGIELHAWVEDFFVGSDSETQGPGPVLSVYPQWAAVERDHVGASKPEPSSQEPGYYFLDPANPDARTYVKSILQEILTKYNVNGLHLDYIRYPVSLPWDTAGFSYSDASRAMFKAQYGTDPYTLTPDDALWQTWNTWRENQVTSFVQEIRAMQKQVAPKADLSAAVFPNPDDGLAKKFQNWGAWVDSGLVDFLTGMSFGMSANSAATDTAAMRTRVGGNQLLYTATYGPLNGSDPSVVLDQVDASRGADSDGAALFAYNQLTDDQVAALHDGVFRDTAITPHSDLAGATSVGVKSLRSQVNSAKNSCVDSKVATDVDKTLQDALKLVSSSDPAKAALQLNAAATALSASPLPGDGPALFVSRSERDLKMYARWLNRIPTQGPTPPPSPTPTPSPTAPNGGGTPAAGPSGQLPATGTTSGMMALLALALCVAGAGTLLVIRRRRPS